MANLAYSDYTHGFVPFTGTVRYFKSATKTHPITGVVTTTTYEQDVTYGSATWRANNPIALTFNGSYVYQGMIGTLSNGTVSLAIFRTEAEGEAACRANLFDNDHSSMTVAARVSEWEPQNPNYATLVASINSDNEYSMSQTMSSLSSSQRNALFADMKVAEGWNHGGTVGSVVKNVVITPLVMDLNGDGVQTLSVDAGVAFDLDGDGKKEKTGWADKNDGFLVLDKNGNNEIDDGSELFGSNTLKSNGQLARDGFDALAEYDSNNDGKISDADPVFEKLLVWKDGNSNGHSEKGELFALKDLGISEISLKYAETWLPQGNGNVEGLTGSFTRGDGAPGVIADIYFATASNSNNLDQVATAKAIHQLVSAVNSFTTTSSDDPFTNAYGNGDRDGEFDKLTAVI